MLSGYASDTWEVSVRESKLMLKPNAEINCKKKIKYIEYKSSQINNIVQGDLIKVKIQLVNCKSVSNK